MLSPKKFLFAALLLIPSAAFAQEQPTSGGGSPENERMTTEATKIEPEAEDPTAHFNFFNFSYRGKDEFGGTFGDGVMTDEKTGETVHEEEPMSAPFVLALLNFGILLVILGKYGGPAARKLAEERHDQIKSALDEAAKIRQQAEDKLADYEKRTKNVDAEITEMLADIRAAAEADKARILEAAEKQAAQMKHDAELRIAAEIETARAALAQEVAAAATAATEKILKEKTTADDQQKLVATFISGMPTTRSEAR